jgi:hypothetical protein
MWPSSSSPLCQFIARTYNDNDVLWMVGTDTSTFLASRSACCSSCIYISGVCSTQASRYCDSKIVDFRWHIRLTLTSWGVSWRGQPWPACKGFWTTEPVRHERWSARLVRVSDTSNITGFNMGGHCHPLLFGGLRYMSTISYHGG